MLFHIVGMFHFQLTGRKRKVDREIGIRVGYTSTAFQRQKSLLCSLYVLFKKALPDRNFRKTRKDLKRERRTEKQTGQPGPLVSF